MVFIGPCLLCEQFIAQSASWYKLLGYQTTSCICKTCTHAFERADIVSTSESLHSIYSSYHYNEAMKQYIYQYKFLQDIALAEVFVKDFQEVLKGHRHIVPIPMHENRKKQRTFSHVEQFLKCAKISYEDVLVKTEDVVMGEKSKEERLAMKSLFQLAQDVQIHATNYTLVDDLYTTGATLQQAANILLEAGATSVEAVTLIRA